MFSLLALRRAYRELTAKTVGIVELHPRWSMPQKKGATETAVIVNLPTIPVDKAQITDPADPNFKKMCFMAGYDPIGDANYPVCGPG